MKVGNLDTGLCGVGQQSRFPAALQAQERREGIGCFGNLPTTRETLSEEAASPYACSVCHIPNDPISHAVQPSFQLSEACWKAIQTGFKSNTKNLIQGQEYPEGENIIQCKTEKIQIRCRETRRDSSLNSLLI